MEFKGATTVSSKKILKALRNYEKLYEEACEYRDNLKKEIIGKMREKKVYYNGYLWWKTPMTDGEVWESIYSGVLSSKWDTLFSKGFIDKEQYEKKVKGILYGYTNTNRMCWEDEYRQLKNLTYQGNVCDITPIQSKFIHLFEKGKENA